MWPGPYGEWGSKKYLVASLDQSLKRMDLDYVDIYYSHRPDPDTPLEETIGALDQIVRQGKALYAGISSYDAAMYRESVALVKERGWAPITIHQPCYNMLDRWIEPDLIDATGELGSGVIVFSPLAQGMLTNKYLNPDTAIPQQSRAADPDGFLQEHQVTAEKIEKVRKLSRLAEERGQTMAQFALAWTLRDKRVTSTLIGARTPEQVKDCVGAIESTSFTEEELGSIEQILSA